MKAINPPIINPQVKKIIPAKSRTLPFPIILFKKKKYLKGSNFF